MYRHIGKALRHSEIEENWSALSGAKVTARVPMATWLQSHGITMKPGVREQLLVLAQLAHLIKPRSAAGINCEEINFSDRLWKRGPQTWRWLDLCLGIAKGSAHYFLQPWTAKLSQWASLKMEYNRWKRCVFWQVWFQSKCFVPRTTQVILDHSLEEHYVF